jgi:obg-like ATPase 1
MRTKKKSKNCSGAAQATGSKWASWASRTSVPFLTLGKSTTFNLLSKLNVQAENYPFCTIEPNQAKVPVPDERFDVLCQMYKPKSKVQSVLSILDIAGLVRGASKGEGLGNAFLSNISGTDGIFHVVRAFEDAEVTHHELTVDPVRDMEIISEELCLKDLEMVEKRIIEVNKLLSRKNEKKDVEEKELLEKVKALL